VLVGRVIDDEIDDDADTSLVCLLDELHEVVEVSVLGKDREEVTDVVTAVAKRGLIEGE
jgi:hypothetical protein